MFFFPKNYFNCIYVTRAASMVTKKEVVSYQDYEATVVVEILVSNGNAFETPTCSGKKKNIQVPQSV